MNYSCSLTNKIDSCIELNLFAVYETLVATRLRSGTRLMTAHGSSSNVIRLTHAIRRLLQVAAVKTDSVRVRIASLTESGRRVPSASLVVRVIVTKENL